MGTEMEMVTATEIIMGTTMVMGMTTNLPSRSKKRKRLDQPR
ncbi:hypothetical protein SAMD00020551_0736 [Mesobacillus selenatarsenatis SF-1]|uniref:Uncharacterized protein n=1 Tax=Mesobacillus selenatarsenatis (strain DSM 18680 / JCM 14380 / FERM P-15431 / SF-1) TaxID=1321606 RepID=A0A0A8X369_MESS1|nr:hypothetical protein SAMD00020551_0736 [Mesobacillus selenatarsenatis SF-1]